MTGGCLPLSPSHSSTDAIPGGALTMYRERSASHQATGYGHLKRALDVLLAALALLLLGPPMLLIAAIIRLDTPGPVLCIQRRVGKGGRVFPFYKFRSMYGNVDHTISHRSFSKGYINGHGETPPEGAGNGHFKPAGNGSSVTPVGHWLRKYSLDELPQLVNVLKGDMSLVGPRPSMDYEVEEYADRHLQRLAVVPGITGLAQINGRSTLAFDDIVTFDIQYIERRSLWLDLTILLRTAPVVLLAHGAS